MRQFDIALRLIDCRVARFGRSEGATIAAIHIAFSANELALAARRLSNISPEEFEASLQLRVKRLQYHCRAGQFGLAKEALQALQPLGALPNPVADAVIECVAELDDWSSVYEIAMAKLDASFDFGLTGLLIVRAIRRSSRHDDALVRLDELLAHCDTASIRRLRAIVLEDSARDESGLSAMLGDDKLDEFGPLRERISIKRLVAGGTRLQPARAAIFYCTDSRYLGPTFVSLISLIGSNRDLLERCDVFIVVDDGEACALARRLAARLSERFGISQINIVPRGDTMDDGVELKTAYGMFAPGQSLPEAAYYRIYFAQELCRQNRYKKALYIDCDTLIQRSLSALIDRNSSAALMASLERSDPNIERAIRTHGLPQGQYFNSGVLALDLDHPELAPALERSICAIRDQRQTLLYHDQCALNIGFKGVFEALDPVYNFFVDPNDPEPKSDCVILHYLGRPKPWDPAYGGELCRLWFLHWYQLSVHIGREDALRLYNMSNRD